MMRPTRWSSYFAIYMAGWNAALGEYWWAPLFGALGVSLALISRREIREQTEQALTAELAKLTAVLEQRQREKSDEL